MQSDHSKSVHSLIRPVLPGVFCPPLNLRFPTVFRIVQSVTRQQLDEYGLHDLEPIQDCNHYTLAEPDLDLDAGRYPGTIVRTRLQSLDPAIDRVSLVIRRHLSRATSDGYRAGLDDYSVDFGEIIRRTEGIFTLITRPTKPAWPGPLLIHSAELTDDTAHWVVAVAPDGTLIEGFDDLGPAESVGLKAW
jgi:hypothetical protein